MLFCFALVLVQSHQLHNAQATASKHPAMSSSQTQSELSGSSPAPATPLQPVAQPEANASATQANTAGDNVSQPAKRNNRQATSGNNQDGGIVKQLLNKL